MFHVLIGPRSGDLRLVQNGVTNSSYTRGRLHGSLLQWTVGDCVHVMTLGLPQTRVWLVVNLDFLLPASAGPPIVLEGEYFLEFCYDELLLEKLSQSA